MPKALFPLGRLVATPGALEALQKSGEGPTQYLVRHQSGDWGKLSQDDKDLNDEAVNGEGWILSAYHLKNGTKIWIITEWDRSATTILLPEEY